MQFLVKQDDGTCARKDVTSSGGGIVISASVGKGGANRSDDVRTIQDALNQVSTDDGGPDEPLVVDGWIGPKTVGAITKFQNAQFGRADGRVDPNQQTIARLNELVGSSEDVLAKAGDGSAGGTSPVLRLTKLQTLIPQARACILAAQSKILFASLSFGGLGSLGGNSAADLLNLHFQLDQMDNPSLELSKLGLLYRRMDSVFAHPGGLWGEMTFEFDPESNNKEHDHWFAYTFPGGFDRGGEHEGALRADTIYLCPVLDRTTDDGAIQTIIHEMAHFVGLQNKAEEIDDFAYGQVDGRAMKALPPDKRVRNAETIGNYAFEAKFGRQPRYH